MKPIFLLFFTVQFILTGFSQTTYTFIGTGNWTVSSNWSSNTIPPNPLPAGSTINISPVGGGNCFLNINQVISRGANLFVSTGANFILTGISTLNPFADTMICNQDWMVRNLELVTYRNGDSIPQVSNPAQWTNLTTGAWCYYNNDSATGSVYGKLYNWYAVHDPRGLVPQGWHIPTYLEWSVLTSCMGGNAIAGGPMKDTGFLHWNSPNSGATNSSGFTALPGGDRDSSGPFYSLGFNGLWWSADSVSPTRARYIYLYSYYEGVGWTDVSFRTGMSVRCLKNALPELTTVPPEVTATNCISGGVISSDGGDPVIAKGVVWSTSPNPTVALTTKTNDGTGVAFYNSIITGLQPNTMYYLRAYASSNSGTGYGNEISFVNTVADSDIVICSQHWMTKNLKVTTYKNGDPIPQVTDPAQWANLTTGAWCYYNNDPATASVYGKLYNWYAVNDPRGLAPAGWHLPSVAELTTLSTCLGGDAVSGGALKEAGTVHWVAPNTGATNSSGFKALPGGNRYDNGSFYDAGYAGCWWTITPSVTGYAYYMYLTFDSEYMSKPNAAKTDAFSVRCLRN
jgi:uncharacterized protein (TIGR02145 family)